MGTVAFLLFAVTFGASASPPELLRGYRQREAPTGPVYSRGWSGGEVGWVEEFLPRALARVEARLGRSMGRSFTTILVDGYGELRRLTRALRGGDPDTYTAGVAFPWRNVLVVRRDLAATLRPENSAKLTLTHEVAHLVLHRRPETDLPRWLDEGLAMWVSQGALSYRDDAEMSLYARTGSLYSLESLEKAFPRQHLETSVAYRESLLVVLFLESRHGEQGIRDLLDSIEAGTPSWEALSQLTGLSREALEAEFFGWVASRHSLLEVAGALLNIWTLVALLALVAIGRYMWKRRRALRELAASDAEGP
jgi:hypothetical protein